MSLFLEKIILQNIVLVHFTITTNLVVFYFSHFMQLTTYRGVCKEGVLKGSPLPI